MPSLCGSAEAVVEIDDSFVDERAYDPFLEPRIRRRGRPDRLEVLGERVKRDWRKGGPRRGRIMVGDARLAGGHADQGAVPARLELAGDKAVLGIGRVILPEGAVGRVARRLEVADQGLARFVALRGRLRLGGPRRLHRGRLHDGQERGLDHVVDAQPPERDTARLTVIEPAAHAGVARDLPLGPGVLHAQLAAAATAPQQARQQRRTELGGAAGAGWDVLAHHRPDRLRTVPLEVTFMRAGLQRQPFGAGLAPRPRFGPIVAGRDAGAPVGVGAPVSGVGDELVKGRVAGATPFDRTGVDPGGQVELVLQEPEEGLAYAAQFGDLVDGEADRRRLDAPVGVLLQPVADLDEADRGRHDKLAAACLLMACRERALPQKVEFVLVEAALETQEQAVVAQTRRVDHLLVDEERVDDAAHFNELLPISAVAREARDLPGCHRADLAQADLGDHALEPGARGSAGGRAAEVLVDDLDLRPAELRKTVAHGVLEPLALAVVLNLMSGGLTDVKHRLAGPVLGADLVIAHCRRPRVGPPAFERRWRARRAGGSETPSASAAPAPAERTKPAE